MFILLLHWFSDAASQGKTEYYLKSNKIKLTQINSAYAVTALTKANPYTLVRD